MESLTRWTLAHRRVVVGLWIAFTIVGVFTASAAVKAMDQKFTVPGREGWEANQSIAHRFGGTGGDAAPLVPVVTLPAGKRASDPDVRRELAALERRLTDSLPGARIASAASADPAGFSSANGRTTFAVVYPKPDPAQPFGENPQAEQAARAALRGATIGGAPVHLSGFDALSAASGDQGGGAGLLLEALLGGVGALVVLLFVFGSLLAFLPLLMAIPAILTSFLAVYGLTTFTGVSPVVQFLIALIGLGVAIDYALIIVVRWREEIARGAEGDEAIVRAMGTAGRAVVFSGTTVAVGLLALVVLPVPFLRSVGFGGLLIPLVSVLVALTLLPCVLRMIGPKLEWPHRRTEEQGSRRWMAWARGVVRHRVLAIVGSLLVLAALGVAASNLKPGISDVDTIAKAGDAKQGLAALERSGIGAGALLPYEILAPAGSADRVRAAAAGVDGMSGAVAPASWRAGDTAVVDAFARADNSTATGRALVDDVRAVVHRAAPPTVVGGQPSQNEDFISAVYGSFPLMIALIALLTFLLLARAFRSLLLPLKAVVLNIISVAAAWGVMELVWQEGHGSSLLWGIAATGAVTAWIPLMVFAFLFGLSMDYEVFILARMREEYDATGDTDEAVVRGIGRTGRLVTSAALILFLAFVAMASGPETDIKTLATGLAAGILIDATIIRTLLVPATVSLFGRWNWILPSGPARLLRVAPSPLRPEVAPSSP
jgi:RND superfamily putative drug exporter